LIFEPGTMRSRRR